MRPRHTHPRQRLRSISIEDDRPTACHLLEATSAGLTGSRRFLTHFRQGYCKAIQKCPPDLVLAGSDLPFPVFELSADVQEHAHDFAAIRRGALERMVAPQDSVLDVNWRELTMAFGDHPMCRNAAAVLGQALAVATPSS